MSLEAAPNEKNRSFIDPWALVLGVVIRVAAFPFAENLTGDSPVRSEIAAKWAAHPGFLWSFANVFQFGPLPLNLGGLMIRLGLGHDTGPRLLSLAFGIASLVAIMVLAGRIGGATAARTAGYALALCPSHIRASTTFTSEAMYLAFVTGCLIATIDRRYRIAGVLLALATITRFDAWLWLPAWALLAMWRESAKPNWRARAGIVIACIGPLTILMANGWASGHPFAPLTHIHEDHAHLAAATQERLGPILWRAATVLFWPAAIFITLTPAFGAWLFQSAPRWKWTTTEALFILIAALLPPSVYAVQSMANGSFWPMLRLALPPAALLLCFLPPPGKWTVAICSAIAIATGGISQALYDAPGAVGQIAERLAPIDRLPADLRAGVKAVKEAKGHVLIDEGPAWEDIAISYHSGSDRFTERWRAEKDKLPPDRIITIKGGRLDAQLRATGSEDGVTFLRTGEVGRISWWDRGATVTD